MFFLQKKREIELNKAYALLSYVTLGDLGGVHFKVSRCCRSLIKMNTPYFSKGDDAK